MIPAPRPNRPRHRFRYSLRALMLVVLLVAVWLGGRASTQMDIHSVFTPRLAGTWTANLPAGFRQPTTLTDLGNGKFLLSSKADSFNGTYEWRDGTLVMTKPADARMQGLVWKWDGTTLLLIGEPADTPTGPSYLGTKLTRKP